MYVKGSRIVCQGESATIRKTESRMTDRLVLLTYRRQSEVWENIVIL